MYDRMRKRWREQREKAKHIQDNSPYFQKLKKDSEISKARQEVMRKRDQKIVEKRLIRKPKNQTLKLRK